MIRKLLSICTLGLVRPTSPKNRARIAEARLADAQREALRADAVRSRRAGHPAHR